MPIKKELKTIVDDPEWDGTDFAHPAFWRGQDDGVRGVIMVLSKVLDYQDDGSGVMGNERLELLRRRVIEIRDRLDRGKKLK